MNFAQIFQGFIKLIYCRGLDQAYEVKKILDTDLNNAFEIEILSVVKRGCSEFPIKFPNYGKINSNLKTEMDYPLEWQKIEKNFDKKEQIIPKHKLLPSISNFCLSDFKIIEKWLDYARGLEDPSCEKFKNKPIIYSDIYKAAALRKI